MCKQTFIDMEANVSCLSTWGLRKGIATSRGGFLWRTQKFNQSVDIARKGQRVSRPTVEDLRDSGRLCLYQSQHNASCKGWTTIEPVYSLIPRIFAPLIGPMCSPFNLSRNDERKILLTKACEGKSVEQGLFEAVLCGRMQQVAAVFMQITQIVQRLFKASANSRKAVLFAIWTTVFCSRQPGTWRSFNCCQPRSPISLNVHSNTLAHLKENSTLQEILTIKTHC